MTDTTINSSAQKTFSTSDSEVYRALSRGAVVSVALAALGMTSFVAVYLLVLPLFGIICGAYALKSIKQFPDELLGKPLAMVGITTSVVILLFAPAYHAYIYATEVPEGYERISFFSLMADKDRGQPDIPTPDAIALNGKQVFVKGYVHPSSMSSYEAKKFVIVPDLGTCCFGGQPPLTHMIEVTLTGDQYAHKDYYKKRLAGKFTVNEFLKPIDGLEGVYYQLRADILK